MVKLNKRIVIFGVSLTLSKRLILALTEIYGIGLKMSRKLVAEAGISPWVRVHELTEEQHELLIKKIKAELRIEQNLRDFVQSNIQRLILAGTRRGFCHRNHLPVRGQRTRTNARTARKMNLNLIKTVKSNTQSVKITKKSSSAVKAKIKKKAK